MVKQGRLPFLGRRRGKAKRSPTEWVETLLPREEEGAEPAEGEFAPTPREGPGPMLAGRAEGSQFVFPISRLPRDEKRMLEQRVAGTRLEALVERGYAPRSPMALREIESYIDKHLGSRRLPPAMRPRGAPPPVRPPLGRPAARVVGIPVSDVVDQRIVYETEAGRVLEVTRRTSAGLEREYYTISKVDRMAEALDLAGRMPARTLEEARRPLEPAAAPTPSGPATLPEAPPAAEPEPAPEPVPPAEAPPEAVRPAEEAEEPEEKGRLGRLAGRLKFRRKEKGEPEEAASAPPAEPEPPAEKEEGGRLSRLRKLRFRRKG